MPYFSGNAAKIYYETHGSGPPLMLIAGLASDSQSWLPLVPSLAERFTLIMPDNRGVGRSDQQCGTTIGLMADDCMALLASLGISDAILLGHSMGGMIAMECAARYPESVSGLILAATAASNSPRNNMLFEDWAVLMESGTTPEALFRSIFYWIFTERFFRESSVVDSCVSGLMGYPWPQTPSGFRRQIRAIRDFDAGSVASRIRARTLIIAGGRDILMPPPLSGDLSRMISGSRLTVIEEAAHSIHMEYPGEFIDAVLDFIG